MAKELNFPQAIAVWLANNVANSHQALKAPFTLPEIAQSEVTAGMPKSRSKVDLAAVVASIIAYGKLTDEERAQNTAALFKLRQQVIGERFDKGGFSYYGVRQPTDREKFISTMIHYPSSDDLERIMVLALEQGIRIPFLGDELPEKQTKPSVRTFGEVDLPASIFTEINKK